MTGNMQCSSSQAERFVNESAYLGHAVHLVRFQPSMPAQKFFSSNIEAVQGKNPTVINQMGLSRDLRVWATTSAAKNRHQNNSLVSDVTTNGARSVATINLCNNSPSIMQSPSQLKSIPEDDFVDVKMAVKSPATQFHKCLTKRVSKQLSI